MCCGTALCAGSITQQFALLYTPVGKAGFLTACYILIVPLLGLLFGRRCGVKHWCGVALAMAGLYFLCMTGGSFGFAMGDLIGLSCALLFSIHITVIDHFSPMVDGVKMSCIQFFFCAILSGIGMLIFEQPSFANILAAWKPILYAGAMSSGVGYTLQIIGQKGMNPAVASLIMSLESVISVIAGWLILGQALSGREIFGCVLMFGAIVLAQLPERKKTERIMQKTDGETVIYRLFFAFCARQSSYRALPAHPKACRPHQSVRVRRPDCRRSRCRHRRSADRFRA